MIRDMEDMLKIIHELALFEKDVYMAGEKAGRAMEALGTLHDDYSSKPERTVGMTLTEDGDLI